MNIRPYHIIQVTPEPSSPESTTSHDDGIVIPVEEVEESITKAVVHTHASYFGAIGA